MTEPAPRPAIEVLAPLPLGLWVHGGDGGLLSTNAALHDMLGVPPGTFPPGSSFAANVQAMARHGVSGPGDPSGRLVDLLQPDSSARLHVHHADGRRFEIRRAATGDGGVVTTLTETPPEVHRQEAVERTLVTLSQIIADLRCGLAVFDPDGRLAIHNARFPDLLGLPVAGLVPGVPYAEVMERVAVHVEAADPGSLARLVRLDPHPGPAAMADLQLRVDGRVLDLARDRLASGAVVVTVSDITALTRAQDEASRRASLLEATVGHFPHGVVVIGPDERVAMVNHAHHRMFAGATVAVGERLEEVVLRWARPGEFWTGDAVNLARDMKALDHAQLRQFRRGRPDGSMLDVLVAPLPGGGWLHVVTDVTAQTRAQGELRRAAGDMRAMLASIRHGIILWDEDRRIVACNPVAEALLQTRPGFLRSGTTLDELIEDAGLRGNLGEGVIQQARSANLMSQDRSQSHYDRRFTRQGQVLDVRSDPIAGGGFVTTYTDVTAMHRGERELKAAKAAAEAANDAKSRFLAIVSHELRTPLNQVLGFADSLLRMVQDAQAGHGAAGGPAGSVAGLDGGSDAGFDAGFDVGDVAEYAQSVQAAGLQLLGMIDNILDVARLETGRFDLNADRVVLPQLVRSCIRQSAAAAAAAGVALTVDLPDDPPLLDADERRLRQALMHLLANAIKFTQPPGSVRVAVLAEASGLRLLVHDTGIGIAASDLPRLNEPFTQLDAGLSRRYGGAGLGLHLTRAIMAAHGGTLDIASMPGVGTTASLLFPSARVVPTSPVPPATEPA